MTVDGGYAIHFAVTSHGFGHLTRMLAILRQLTQRLPDCRLHISSMADATWLKRELDFDVSWRVQDYEPGAVQSNCFEVDVPATLKAYRVFESEYDGRLESECKFLRSQPFAGVITDIPALAVRAAYEVGLPVIGISNFTWDWIIEPWCDEESRTLVERLRQDYARGTRHLRLPLGPSASSFPAHEEAPLVSRLAALSPEAVRDMLELGAQRIVLVCPGGWSPNDWPAIFARPGDFQLVTVGDLPIDAGVPLRRLGHALPAGLNLTDLVAAADVVLGKAGYGLASECAVHGVPFAMIERPNFRETPLLIRQFREIGRSATCSTDEFFSGNWEQLLERAVAAPPPPKEVPRDGANLITERIIELLGMTSAVVD